MQGIVVCGDGRVCVMSGFHALVFNQSGGQPFPCLAHIVGGAVMTGDVINSLISVKSVYFIFPFWSQCPKSRVGFLRNADTMGLEQMTGKFRCCFDVGYCDCLCKLWCYVLL